MSSQRTLANGQENNQNQNGQNPVRPEDEETREAGEIVPEEADEEVPRRRENQVARGPRRPDPFISMVNPRSVRVENNRGNVSVVSRTGEDLVDFISYDDRPGHHYGSLAARVTRNSAGLATLAVSDSLHRLSAASTASVIVNIDRPAKPVRQLAYSDPNPERPGSYKRKRAVEDLTEDPRPNKRKELDKNRPTKCTNTGCPQPDTHLLSRCVGPPSDAGDMYGCCLCDDSTHLTDTCKYTGKYSESERYERKVKRRAGLPPFRSIHSWVGDVLNYAEAEDPLPLTYNFVKAVFTPAKPWETFDYANYEASHRRLSKDPTTATATTIGPIVADLFRSEYFRTDRSAMAWNEAFKGATASIAPRPDVSMPKERMDVDKTEPDAPVVPQQQQAALRAPLPFQNSEASTKFQFSATPRATLPQMPSHVPAFNPADHQAPSGRPTAGLETRASEQRRPLKPPSGAAQMAARQQSQLGTPSGRMLPAPPTQPPTAEGGSVPKPTLPKSTISKTLGKK